jgi:hypothetical protein
VMLDIIPFGVESIKVPCMNKAVSSLSAAFLAPQSLLPWVLVFSSPVPDPDFLSR